MSAEERSNAAGGDGRGRGLLVVVSSPSGGGKTTVIKRLLEMGGDRFTYSVSATTRKPRAGEVDGRDYFFLSEEEFRERLKRGEFVEYAEVHGYLYGTLRSEIERKLRDGKVIFLDIDVQGGASIRRAFPDDSLLVFLAPPSLETLEERLRARGTDSEEEIRKRLARVPMELEASKQYDLVVVNDDLGRVTREVFSAIRERLESRTASVEPGGGRKVETG